MVAIVPASVEEHVAVVRATAPGYFKGVSDLTFRKRLWLAMLMRYGQVEYGVTGHSMTWNVEYSEPDVTTDHDGSDLQFNEHDPLLQLTLGIRGYRATDMLTDWQKMINMGGEQIDDMYKNKSKRLSKSMRRKLCGELYVDGNAANNTRRWHGIESCLGEANDTVVGDKVAKPDDSYAGKDTDLGAQTGTWSSDLAAADRPNAALANDWPLGSGSTEYDVLSPLLVNDSSTAWPSGSNKWIDNCEDVLRFILTVQAHRGAFDENPQAPFMFLESVEKMVDLKTYFSARNRQIIPHKAGEDLGFPDTLQFEGAVLYSEFDTPAGVGYGISPSHMELGIQGGQLITPRGPEYTILKDAYLYLAKCRGNLRLQPKFLSKHKAYASA